MHVQTKAAIGGAIVWGIGLLAFVLVAL